MTIKESTNKEEFNPALFYPFTPFTQAFFYGEWQKNSGRHVRRFLITDENDVGNKVLGSFQVIKFSLPFNKSFLYIPYGPVLFCDVTTSLLLDIKKFLLNLAKEEGSIFVRTDFTISERNKNSKIDLGKIFQKAKKHTYHSAQFQPRFEWYLDLHRSYEDILRDMHKNTRYSVRLAEKSQVSTEIIEENLSKYFDTFYSILEETSKRDGFSLHSKDYYKNIFDLCDKDKNAILVLSSHSGEVISANLVILYGEIAMFIFGGTSNENRKVMPAYASQNATIKYLKEKGYRWYNFGGVSEKEDNHEGWSGLTSFKKRFGGHLVRHEKFYDVVSQPFWYFVYNFYKRFKRVYVI